MGDSKNVSFLSRIMRRRSGFVTEQERKQIFAGNHSVAQKQAEMPARGSAIFARTNNVPSPTREPAKPVPLSEINWPLSFKQEIAFKGKLVRAYTAIVSGCANSDPDKLNAARLIEPYKKLIGSLGMSTWGEIAVILTAIPDPDAGEAGLPSLGFHSLVFQRLFGDNEESAKNRAMMVPEELCTFLAVIEKGFIDVLGADQSREIIRSARHEILSRHHYLAAILDIKNKISARKEYDIHRKADIINKCSHFVLFAQVITGDYGLRMFKSCVELDKRAQNIDAKTYAQLQHIFWTFAEAAAARANEDIVKAVVKAAKGKEKIEQPDS